MLATAFSVMSGTILAPALNIIRDGLGIERWQADLLITTHALFIGIMSPIFGIIIDRWGTKKLFVCGLLAYGVVGSAGLYATNYWVLIGSRALLGTAAAAIFTAVTVMILNLFEGLERAKVMGWQAGGNGIAGTIWPLMGGLLGGISFRAPFGLYMISIPLGLLALFKVPETRQTTPPEEDKHGSVIQVLRAYPVILAIFGLAFAGSLFLYAVLVFLPQILETMHIVNTFHISLFIAAMTVVSAGTALNFKRIRARLSNKQIILISTSFWAMGCLIISQLSSLYAIVFAMMLIGFGQGVFFPTAIFWLGELIPINYRGRVSSYLGALGLFGQFVSPIFFRPVVDHLGLHAVFLVAAGLSALLFLLFLAVIKTGREG